MSPLLCFTVPYILMRTTFLQCCRSEYIFADMDQRGLRPDLALDPDPAWTFLWPMEKSDRL
jgi:hypothetical protein